MGESLRWTIIPTVVGIAAASIAITPTTALAASITRIPGNFATVDPSVPDGWGNLNWVGRGRASAPGDWEFGVTTDDNINGVVDQSQWDWMNGEDVAWNLLWDAPENKLMFTIGGETLTLDQDGAANGVFDGFFLWTTARTDNKVDAGTEMFLQVNTVNGMAVGPNVTSHATAPDGGGQVISKVFYESDAAIIAMSGIARMSWLDGAKNPQDSRARDRVAFKIEGFYTGTDQPESVPEPGTLLGLLALSGAAVAGRKVLQSHA